MSNVDSLISSVDFYNEMNKMNEMNIRNLLYSFSIIKTFRVITKSTLLT